MRQSLRPELLAINDDCEVDFTDFAKMTANWLIDCNIDPNNPVCVPK